MSNPSTTSWTAWLDGSGRWDNRMAAQHLPRYLVRPSSGYKNCRKRRNTSWNDIYYVVSTLGWEIAVKIFENCLRDYFKKMFALIRKQHIDFEKRVRKLLCEITLANATCFQLSLENDVKARQTSESWSPNKQTLTATVTSPALFWSWTNVTSLPLT